MCAKTTCHCSTTGTGKTTTILAAARQLFGSEKMKERVLELNASDDRGIQVVRTKIKEFASTTCAAATVNGKKIPGYKIIILDEADSMTRLLFNFLSFFFLSLFYLSWFVLFWFVFCLFLVILSLSLLTKKKNSFNIQQKLLSSFHSADAQDALRRTLECHTRTTRFCLLCNYVTRIIAPLASRCAKFHFAPLPSTSAAAAVLDVARREHTPLRSDAAAELAAITGGCGWKRWNLCLLERWSVDQLWMGLFWFCLLFVRLIMMIWRYGVALCISFWRTLLKMKGFAVAFIGWFVV